MKYTDIYLLNHVTFSYLYVTRFRDNCNCLGTVNWGNFGQLSDIFEWCFYIKISILSFTLPLEHYKLPLHFGGKTILTWYLTRGWGPKR